MAQHEHWRPGEAQPGCGQKGGFGTTNNLFSRRAFVLKSHTHNKLLLVEMQLIQRGMREVCIGLSNATEAAT